jgi:cytochrome c oxidase subunit III
MSHYKPYYVPTQSPWPFIGAVALGLIAFGGASFLHESPIALYSLGTGALLLFCILFAWFRDVIHESQQKLYSPQMDRSFRWGMAWFIFSEIMFFAAFFGALFYVRYFVMDWLNGTDTEKLGTHEFLWPQFQASWPLLTLPNPKNFIEAKAVIPAWGLPAINTFILISSSITLWFAECGLKKHQRPLLIAFLSLTLALAALFVGVQSYEYYHAIHALDLTIKAGIYGSTFFLLTGFHGFHVILGSFMILIMLFRCLKGHFCADNHFALAAVSWYWHFVDVVWIFLFVFVYWL